MRSFAKSYIKCFECELVFSAVFSAHGKPAEELYDKVWMGPRYQCPKCRSWSCRQYRRGCDDDKPVYNILAFTDSKTMGVDVNEFTGIIKLVCKREFKTLCKYGGYASRCLSKTDPYTLFIQLDEKEGSLYIKVIPCDKEDTAIREYTYDFLTKWYDAISNNKTNVARINCSAAALPDLKVIAENIDENNFIRDPKIDLLNHLEFSFLVNDAFFSETFIRHKIHLSNKGKERSLMCDMHPYDNLGNISCKLYYALNPTEDITEKDSKEFVDHLIEFIQSL